MMTFCAIGKGSEPTKSLALTNVAQLQPDGLFESAVNYRIQLEADVWWADPAANRLVLHDASGTREIELDLQNQPVRAGQRVRLAGNGTITKTANGFRLGVIGPVVDNNGVHGMIEKSGAVYLPAGRQPLRLGWFNGEKIYGLKVDYQGPDLPRQKIPDSVLFRLETGNVTSNWVAGLNISIYDAPGEVLPDFRQLTRNSASSFIAG